MIYIALIYVCENHGSCVAWSLKAVSINRDSRKASHSSCLAFISRMTESGRCMFNQSVQDSNSFKNNWELLALEHETSWTEIEVVCCTALQ